MRTLENFIDGGWTPIEGSNSVAVTNPATGATIANGSHRGRANDAVDFYTDKKVVVSTWHVDTTQQSGVDPAFEGSGTQ